jgi:hypothetical protein
MSIQSGAVIGEVEEIAVRGSDAIAAIRSGSPRVSSRRCTQILIGPGHCLKSWGRFQSLSHELESITMKSSGDRGFSKDTLITGRDDGADDLITCPPDVGNIILELSGLGGNPIDDELSTAVEVAVGNDTNTLFTPGSGDAEAMANNGNDATNLLARGAQG